MLIASLREVIRNQSLELEDLKKLAEGPSGGDENVHSTMSLVIQYSRHSSNRGYKNK
jgi:hypothetical protein